MNIPFYDVQTGEFKGLKETVGYLMLRGDAEEVLFNYGFSGEKSKVLYCIAKERMPSAFVRMAFKKHLLETVNERA